MRITVPKALTESSVKWNGEAGRAWSAGLPAPARHHLEQWGARWISGGDRAFAEFVDCEPIAKEASRLERLRLTVYDRWVETELVLGRHAEVVAALREMPAPTPTRRACTPATAPTPRRTRYTRP
ncbi:BTAD domain-containing putative transcriptional regulator [Nonomuraea sp. NPDC048916]|uniref:BTAD domain-containing putative transcriptional regulator n=1 Tax=Nonomuraea sp. NPDC048916 TaxID=3154232 RepID=UPI003402D33B